MSHVLVNGVVVVRAPGEGGARRHAMSEWVSGLGGGSRTITRSETFLRVLCEQFRTDVSDLDRPAIAMIAERIV